ncbi:uncharacterized protein LOC117923213 [Vitis riparia]|uniref:uncharacterized protein LOC117923213 n=1 Tax=Vitis riparia TaxID=96939 RepID=UPI00155A9412|nr:uncharacterized protein LOC117923213 [Vitis riparia]
MVAMSTRKPEFPLPSPPLNGTNHRVGPPGAVSYGRGTAGSIYRPGIITVGSDRVLEEDKKMDEGGWGAGAVTMVLVVAALLIFVPLGMGPVQAPSPCMLLVFPAVLIFILIFLSHASNQS